MILPRILHHNTADGLGNLAAHSGGSCQASLSFDNGETWKVLHSYQGGCPRDVPFESNMAGLNQVFFFRVPQETKAGPALFSWYSDNLTELFFLNFITKLSGLGLLLLVTAMNFIKVTQQFQ